MLLLPIVVLRVHDLPLLEVEVRFRHVVRIKSVVELVEDGAAAVVVVLGLLPRPHRPRHGHGLAPERAARPLERALDGVGTCVWTLISGAPRHRRNITPRLISARAAPPNVTIAHPLKTPRSRTFLIDCSTPQPLKKVWSSLS